MDGVRLTVRQPLSGASLPVVDECFHVHAQRIRYPVDVIEIADNLCGIVDGGVVKAVPAEHGNIGFGHFTGRLGQFFGVFTQGTVGGTQAGLAPVGGQPVYEQVQRRLVRQPKIVCGLFPEVVCVRTNSVDTVVVDRYHHCEHLAPATVQGRRAVHQGAVKIH